MRLLIAFFAMAVLPCLSADGEYRLYFVHRVTVGANEAITLKQPVSGAREVIFEGLLITSVNACTVSIQQNGAAATATTVTPGKLHTKADAAHALAYVASDAGAGTVIHVYAVPAGQTYPIMKGGLGMAPVAGQQITFVTTCPSATELTLLHSERP